MVGMSRETTQEFIKKQRKLHGMTQADLARRAGVGLRLVRELEQGKPTLRMDKVNQILQLFGRTLGPVAWDSEEREIASRGEET